MFTINGMNWNLRLVGSHSPMLMRSDGTYTFGMTDRNTRDIYISNMIHGNFYDRVLCHELCHAFCLSYNLTMDIQTEEIVADFLATYGREVFALADELISGYMEILYRLRSTGNRRCLHTYHLYCCSDRKHQS